MNKLFKKIAVAAVGFAMAVGVGVAVGSNTGVREARATEFSAKYTVDSTTSVSVTGNAPSGSSASFVSNGGESGKQLTFGNAMTLTLSGYDDCTITGLTLSMKSNSSKGKGSMSLTTNSQEIVSVSDSTFNSAVWNGAWSTTYTEISWPSDANHTLTERTVGSGKTVVFNITNHGASKATNSLYCEWIEITYEAADTRTPTTMTLSESEAFDLDADKTKTLTATLSPNVGSITWSSSDDTVATAASGLITPLKAGNVTITASYAGDATYKPSSASVNVSIKGKGDSPTYPFTTTEARSTATSTARTNTYVRGIIYNVTSYNSTYHSITYWISEDGTGSVSDNDGVQIYSGKGLNNTAFSSIDDLVVGDTVVVKGDLKTYKDAVELDKNNYIVSLEHAAGVSHIEIDGGDTSMTLSTGTKTLTCTHDNEPENYSISWDSSNKNVATITSGGVITALANGVTTITVDLLDLDDNSKSVASHSIKLTVYNAATNKTYRKITEALDNWSGEYLLVYETGNLIFDSSLTTVDVSGNTQAVTISNSKITTSSLYAVTIASMTGGYSIKSASGLYLGNVGDYNGLSSSDTEILNTISYSDGSAVITSNARTAGYNKTAGQERFRFFTSPQEAIQLYKYIEPINITSVELNKNTTTIVNGEHETLTATTSPAGHANLLTWITSDDDIATVSDGVVSCLADSGTATITAFFDANEDGELSQGEPYDSCVVTADKAPIDYDNVSMGGEGTLISSLSNSLSGKKVVIGCSSKDKVAGSLNGSYFNATPATFDNGSVVVGDGIDALANGLLVLTMTGSGDTWTFKTKDNKYLASNSAKSATLSESSFEWTVSISDGVATLSAGTLGTMQYNASSPRFAAYTSSQTGIQLYEFTEYVTEALEFAELFITGNGNNTCAETITNWGTLKGLYADLMDGTKNIFANATHYAPETYTDDEEYSIEHTVARYDDAVLKHSNLQTAENEFMGRFGEGSINGVISSGSGKIAILGEDTSITAVIAIISVTSLAAIGGYFFLRKKKTF